jgi:predicted transcriptional regulator
MVGVMLALGVSQLVAEKIVAPIDDIMIELSGLPFLHEEPPLKFQALVARDVMQGDVVSLSDVSRVRDVVSMLDKPEHNGFPVTTRDEDGKMCGIILRRQLYLLLLRRLWTHEMYSHELKELKRQYITTFNDWGDMQQMPLNLSEQDLEQSLDIRHFMNPTPSTRSRPSIKCIACSTHAPRACR